MFRLILFLVIPSIAFADCKITTVLGDIRPGAQWILYGEVYEGLVWKDEIQSKPSEQEIEQAILNCQQRKVTENTVRVQAQIDLNDQKKTDAERINAIILYLGLDK